MGAILIMYATYALAGLLAREMYPEKKEQSKPVRHHSERYEEWASKPSIRED